MEDIKENFGWKCKNIVNDSFQNGWYNVTKKES